MLIGYSAKSRPGRDGGRGGGETDSLAASHFSNVSTSGARRHDEIATKLRAEERRERYASSRRPAFTHRALTPRPWHACSALSETAPTWERGCWKRIGPCSKRAEPRASRWAGGSAFINRARCCC